MDNGVCSYIKLKESTIICKGKSRSFSFKMKFNSLYCGVDSIGVMVGSDGSTFYFTSCKDNSLKDYVNLCQERGPIFGFNYFSIRY